MTVTVYAKPKCPQCDATCRQLEKCGIEYRKIDVTQATPEELAQMPGYSSAPIVVAGNEHWSGFRPDRIEALKRVA